MGRDFIKIRFLPGCQSKAHEKGQQYLRRKGALSHKARKEKRKEKRRSQADSDFPAGDEIREYKIRLSLRGGKGRTAKRQEN